MLIIFYLRFSKKLKYLLIVKCSTSLMVVSLLYIKSKVFTPHQNNLRVAGAFCTIFDLCVIHRVVYLSEIKDLIAPRTKSNRHSNNACAPHTRSHINFPLIRPSPSRVEMLYKSDEVAHPHTSKPCII